MTRRRFRIIDADHARDLALLRAVREPVFVHEQSVPIELEWDELDPVSRHVVALDLQDRPIGTGRLTPELGSLSDFAGRGEDSPARPSKVRQAPRIGRMAVLRDWRGHGVGAALLERLIELARELRYRRVELHAQVEAIAFYQRHGFVAWGEDFDEAGIRHRHMGLDLAADADAVTDAKDAATP